MLVSVRFPFEPAHHCFYTCREKLEDRSAKLGAAFVLDLTRDDEILQRALAVETAVARPHAHAPKAYHVCKNCFCIRANCIRRSCKDLETANSARTKLKHSSLRLKHILCTVITMPALSHLVTLARKKQKQN